MRVTILTEALQKKLENICDYFGLGALSLAHPATGTNQNYFVVTTKGHFVCKIILTATLEEIQQGLAYVERLKEHDFPAAYYVKAPDGSAIYQQDDCIAVILDKLPGRQPDLMPDVCHTVGQTLARLHLLPSAALPEKRHWLDNNYLPEALDRAKKTPGHNHLRETLKMYEALKDFQPDNFPQSLVHGDLDTTNCLFVDDTLTAFIDWQEVGIGAAMLDFAMAVLGFSFTYQKVPAFPGYQGIFSPVLYQSFYDGYVQVRPFSPYEQQYLEMAVKYAGLTQPVWLMSRWEQYYPGQPLEETHTLFWRYGLHTWSLSTC